MPRSRWSTTRLPVLVGVKEACEILGVDRKQLDRWCEDGSGTNGLRRTKAPPWTQVAATKIWTRADVERFHDELRGQAPATAARGRGAGPPAPG